MDDFATGIVIIVVTVLAAIGVCTVIMDFRHYSIIVKECKENGRIQNRDVRILCQVEERK